MTQNNIFICNLKSKRSQEGFSEHCIKICQHGVYHEKDECTKEEVCSLHKSGNPVKVKCRRITKKEQKELNL